MYGAPFHFEKERKTLFQNILLLSEPWSRTSQPFFLEVVCSTKALLFQLPATTCRIHLKQNSLYGKAEVQFPVNQDRRCRVHLSQAQVPSFVNLLLPGEPAHQRSYRRDARTQAVE